MVVRGWEVFERKTDIIAGEVFILEKNIDTEMGKFYRTVSRQKNSNLNEIMRD